MRLRVTKEPTWFNRAKTRSRLLHFLGMHRVARHNVIPPHMLPCYEVGLVELGQLDLLLGGKAVRVPAGSLVVVPPRTVIESNSEAGMNAGVFYWIGLNPRAARGEGLGEGSGRLLMELEASLARRSLTVMAGGKGLFDAVEHAALLMLDERSPGLAVVGAGWRIAGEVQRSLAGAGEREAVAAGVRVGPALAEIRERPGQVRSMGQLASLCGLGRATFSEEFRRVTGETPRAYLNRTRIAKACRLLRETELSMSQLAQRLGFSSSQYFASVFRRYTGQTPSNYRNGS